MPSDGTPTIDEDPTVIQIRSSGAPTPLSQAAASAAKASPRSATALQREAATDLRHFQAPLAASPNPFLANAAPILDLVVELGAAQSHPDVAGLHRAVAEQLRLFERKMVESGAEGDRVKIASYALCSALDEAVLTTEWGSRSDWSRQSLLSAFHDDVWGGERVFETLAGLRDSRNDETDLLELMAYVIALGFEGRYRVLDGGAAQLEDIRRDLMRTVRQARGEGPKELSPRVKGRVKGGSPFRYMPVWVVVALAGVVLTLSYHHFELEFETKLAPLIKKIDRIIEDPLRDPGKGG